MSGSDDKTLKFWDSSTGEIIRTLKEYTDSVLSIAFSADSRYVITGSTDNSLMVYEFMQGRLEKSIPAHTDGINVVSISQNGALIGTGSNDKTLKIWDSKSLKLIRLISFHKKPINAIAFSSCSVSFSSSNLRMRSLWIFIQNIILILLFKYLYFVCMYLF